jgi:hypothetical protein
LFGGTKDDLGLSAFTVTDGEAKNPACLSSKQLEWDQVFRRLVMEAGRLAPSAKSQPAAAIRPNSRLIGFLVACPLTKEIDRQDFHNWLSIKGNNIDMHTYDQVLLVKYCDFCGSTTQMIDPCQMFRPLVSSVIKIRKTK